MSAGEIDFNHPTDRFEAVGTVTVSTGEVSVEVTDKTTGQKMILTRGEAEELIEDLQGALPNS
ncbi:hypothetical protein [Lacunimicrobium album]